MALKKIKLSITKGKKLVEPIEIFNKLTLRGSIENIWEPQGEALKKWHIERNQRDVVIQMNTGGGKTLVGLLIAQSLVNESKGQIVYVCPNNQLVEQIIDHAKEIGISPAARYKGNWHNREEFESGNTFCVTNYATLFNGLSIFRDQEIDGLVFDDAHVAENVIRGQFTLRIPSDNKVFPKILHLFRKHFANSSQFERFEDITRKRFTRVLFVPMFVVWEHAFEIRKTLIEHGVEGDPNTKFAWEYLKEHLNHCSILANGKGIEITPVVLPLSHLNYFQDDVRRVYLTATLPSRASFIRTFGTAEPKIIQPGGKSGEAQRLFVYVPGSDDDEQRFNAKKLVEGQKSCIISTSHSKGQEWVPPAKIYDTESGQEEIDRFCKSTVPEMLALVARYDGIDLPGDACRILILDRLPTGENLMDRFTDENIRIETIRNSNTATRIVQAIGRIFRSNTDHGVVLLVGPRLQQWVRSAKHLSYLPSLLQKQILLSIELSKQVANGDFSWSDLINGILDGDENWDEMYNEYIDEFDAEKALPTADWHIQMILKEKAAYDQLWQGQYIKAADTYALLAEKAPEHDYRLSAWYSHLRGLSLLCADDKQGAFHNFIKAANSRSELGRPLIDRDNAFKPSKIEKIGQQAKRLTTWYRTKKNQIPVAIQQVEEYLVYGPETNQAEEACRVLGDLLGLATQRPDKKVDTGPDVTWSDDDNQFIVGFELKTDKDEDGEYSKKNIMQCHDHSVWMSNKYNNKIQLIIVGKTLPVSKKANPSDSLLIVEVDAMRDLTKRVKEMFESVEAGDKNNLENAFQTWIDYFGLNWPSCIDSLSSVLAVDLYEE